MKFTVNGGEVKVRTAEVWVVWADGCGVELRVGLPGGGGVRVVVGLDAPVEYPLCQLGELLDEQPHGRGRPPRHRLRDVVHHEQLPLVPLDERRRDVLPAAEQGRGEDVLLGAAGAQQRRAPVDQQVHHLHGARHRRQAQRGVRPRVAGWQFNSIFWNGNGPNNWNDSTFYSTLIPNLFPKLVPKKIY